jgi:2-keto-4-pentenoate hydratase/2-oxohepta-3-ene-1,7-dioic acid hydratase in catechol pathway
MNAALPKKPIIFDKALSRVVKSGDVLYLRGTNEVHHEVELGVLIGKKARNAKAEAWKEHV